MSSPCDSRSSGFIPALLIAAIVPLAGCTLGSAKQAATPPPPKPVVAQPPPPEPPLSVPQTAVVLPAAQPVNEAGIPELPPVQAAPVEKAEVAAPPPRQTKRVAAGPPRPEPDQETEAQTAATPPAGESPPFQPILSEDAKHKYRTSIETRKKEIRDLVGRAKAHPTSANSNLVERIQSFITQSDEAAGRNDFIQADSLSERALILAKELQVE